MRALVRAPMPELGLHRLHGFAARDRLARHRMPPHLVVAEQSESEFPLYELQGPDVAVDERGNTLVRENRNSGRRSPRPGANPRRPERPP